MPARCGGHRCRPKIRTPDRDTLFTNQLVCVKPVHAGLLTGMKTDIVSYALIAFGGFFGAVLRYLVDEQVPTLTGTLIVNFSGCFLMGIFMYESIYIGAFGRNTRIFFTTGVIGAYTTFSALSVQSFQAGPVIGTVNLMSNLLFGLAGVLAGRHLISYQRGI